MFQKNLVEGSVPTNVTRYYKFLLNEAAFTAVDKTAPMPKVEQEMKVRIRILSCSLRCSLVFTCEVF